MIAFFFKKRPSMPMFGIAIGGMFFALSSFLLADHVMVLNEVKNVSVPLVAKLSELERRERALGEQIELSRLHDALIVGSSGEKLDMYVLPEETNFDRIIAFVGLFSENLENQGLLARMSEITFGEADPGDEAHSRFSRCEPPGCRVRPMHISFALHERGVEKVLKLMRVAGLLTVGDALTDDELKTLLEVTEQENPAGIVALEQFLSLDLVRYARDAKSHETQLKRSFVSNAFADTLQSITGKSFLKDARDLFEGDFGKEVLDMGLWPVQFMTLGEAKMTEGGADGWYTLRLEILVWERQGAD